MLKDIDISALDNAIKYHEMLIHMTTKRGGSPSAHEVFTLRALRELRNMKGEKDG